MSTADADITSPARGQYARSEGTRTRILDAALAEAAATGFQNTSVARIAARADVAVGNLNYHFGSKGALLRELMIRQVADFLSRLTPPDEQDDFFGYEATCVATYLEFLEAHPTHVRLAEEVRHLDPELYRAGTAEHIEHIITRLELGITRGDLRSMVAAEVRTQAYLMLGAYTFLDRYLEDADYPGPAAAAATIVALLRNGLEK